MVKSAAEISPSALKSAMHSVTSSAGYYSIFMHIKDSISNGVLALRPEYSIQLANSNIWETTIGCNSLLFTLAIIGISNV